MGDQSCTHPAIRRRLQSDTLSRLQPLHLQHLHCPCIASHPIVHTCIASVIFTLPSSQMFCPTCQTCPISVAKVACIRLVTMVLHPCLLSHPDYLATCQNLEPLIGYPTLFARRTCFRCIPCCILFCWLAALPSYLGKKGLAKLVGQHPCPHMCSLQRLH